MSSALPPLAELFSGTRFPPAFQSAIYSDIGSLLKAFPTLRALNYRRDPRSPPKILIQGDIAVTLSTGKEHRMALSMSLPDNFPDGPPVAQIPPVPGHAVIAADFIRKDGVFNLPAFFAWQPRVSTLPQLVRKIVETVAARPPFALPVLCREAAALVADANERIERAHHAQCWGVQAELYEALGRQAVAQMEGAVEGIRREIAAAGERPLALEPDVQARIEASARIEGYGVAQAALADAYAARTLAFDQYMKATRELARTHFQNTLYDVLQSG
jgi:hypothetical protein